MSGVLIKIRCLLFGHVWHYDKMDSYKGVYIKRKCIHCGTVRLKGIGEEW